MDVEMPASVPPSCPNDIDGDRVQADYRDGRMDYKRGSDYEFASTERFVRNPALPLPPVRLWVGDYAWGSCDGLHVAAGYCCFGCGLVFGFLFVAIQGWHLVSWTTGVGFGLIFGFAAMISLACCCANSRAPSGPVAPPLNARELNSLTSHSPTAGLRGAIALISVMAVTAAVISVPSDVDGGIMSGFGAVIVGLASALCCCCCGIPLGYLREHLPTMASLGEWLVLGMSLSIICALYANTMSTDFWQYVSPMCNMNFPAGANFPRDSVACRVGTAFQWILTPGLVEETVKALLLTRFVVSIEEVRRRYFMRTCFRSSGPCWAFPACWYKLANDPWQILIASLAMSTGFDVVENYMYIGHMFGADSDTSSKFIGLFLRTFVGGFLHMCWTGTIGVYFARLKFAPSFAAKAHLVVAVLSMMVIHGLYDWSASWRSGFPDATFININGVPHHCAVSDGTFYLGDPILPAPSGPVQVVATLATAQLIAECQKPTAKLSGLVTLFLGAVSTIQFVVHVLFFRSFASQHRRQPYARATA